MGPKQNYHHQIIANIHHRLVATTAITTIHNMQTAKGLNSLFSPSQPPKSNGKQELTPTTMVTTPKNRRPPSNSSGEGFMVIQCCTSMVVVYSADGNGGCGGVGWQYMMDL
ncbi:hypothetical protein QVD17_37379 [Tagetes erecta]|uniref:Uncharacterized protein n=1 Tax=Tagetes erecta TaxID=13708 RepID=A0AAD8NJZ6_TARER|nr:hypothetical protein QVD17_37379 [Tagetes erecta]